MYETLWKFQLPSLQLSPAKTISISGMFLSNTRLEASLDVENITFLHSTKITAKSLRCP
jgi:ABC-type iron transport system FetAB permease component